MPFSTRGRWPWAVAAVLTVVAVIAGGLFWRGRSSAEADQGARAAASEFVNAWAAGRPGSVAYAGTASAEVQASYTALTEGMPGARSSVRLGDLDRTGDTATGPAHVRWSLPGGATWAYEVPVKVVRAGDRWAVQAPGDRSLFAPVPAGSRLRASRLPAKRGEILGRAGAVLVTDRRVVDVGVQPSRVQGDAGSLATRLAGIVDVEATALAERIRSAAPDAFVPVITLRRTDYERVRAKLRPLPGVVFSEGTRPLAPTRDFARALLGTAGPVTAEMVDAGNGRYVAGDLAGISGLQRQYDERLGGRSGTRVTATSAAGGAATEVFASRAKPGTSITLTLDPAVQQAADAALASSDVEAALVAVDVPTGAVLAVANVPSSGLNRALVGRYPPGSTFKVVSTLALLSKGLSPAEPVACPATATVQGRAFRNYEGEVLGTVPFRTDFAKSCNTAFVHLSTRLDDDDLTQTARSLGIGGTWSLGTDAYSGNVPSPASPVEKAAATFGQGRTLVSPLAVTVATAAVARGSYRPPTLVSDPAPREQPGGELPLPEVSQLRSLMRDVVTRGTGTALRSVPGEPVMAKTGTAEFGTQSPPQTHAWITGWQGDVAFTVFVGEGKSGGSVAGPVAARFLRNLAAG